MNFYVNMIFFFTVLIITAQENVDFSKLTDCKRPAKPDSSEVQVSVPHFWKAKLSADDFETYKDLQELAKKYKLVILN